MATTETEDRTSFRSNLRKDPNRTVGGTRERRRVFEDSNSTSSSSSTYSTGGATSRYSRAAHDRTDLSPSSGRTTTSSLTNKTNRLNLNDDEDDRDEKDDRRGEEEEETTSRRLKKTGGASIASKINSKLYNDEDGGDDSDEKKDEDEQAAPKKSLKKPKSAGAGNKRKERKNLREKRRSTGVVIMPGVPVTPGDEEERQVQENTARNMGDNVEGAGASGGATTKDDLETTIAKQNETIEQLRDDLASATREIDQLKTSNLRLKDEHSALLRVVGSLTNR